MSENETRSLKEAKEVAFYSAGLSMWYQNRMDFSKHLMTLSTASVAGLLALKPAYETPYFVALWATSIFFFVACIGLILTIFQANAKLLMLVLKEEGIQDQNNFVTHLGLASRISFLLAVIFAIVAFVINNLN